MRGRPILRLAIAAFLADMALYLVMTGVPYRALAFGAGAFALGLLPAARGIPYSISTMWAGAFTERGDRLRAARITLIVAVLAVIAFIFVRGLPGIFVLLVLLGFAFAFYWPAIQAALADLGAQGITRSIGWFNMSWSAGKATGFAVGGALLAAFGFPVLFLVAAIAIVGVLVLIAFPLPKPTGNADAVLLSGLPRAPGEVRAFRHASWIANAIAYGIASVLNLHYPHWLRQIGHGEVLLGTYLGLVFGSQTLSFFLLTRFPGWRHRVAPLLLLQAPMVLALAVLPFLRAPWAILATAPLVGLGLGIAYFASLFYSVEAPRDRGRNAGAHESVLTIGSVIVPVLAGLLATATHHLETPYFLAAAIGGAGLGAQGLLLRGRTG